MPKALCTHRPTLAVHLGRKKELSLTDEGEGGQTQRGDAGAMRNQKGPSPITAVKAPQRTAS